MSMVVSSGVDLRFVTDGPDRGLYLNGHKITGVLSVEPDLFQIDDIATVTIKLAVSSFKFASSDE